MTPMGPAAPAPILVISGPFVSAKDRSPVAALRKQVAAFRASSAPWYDVHLKVLSAEHLLAARVHRLTRRYARAPYRPTVDALLADRTLFEPPELAEVILATLLAREGFATSSLTVAELFADAPRRDALLAATPVVFVSATLLRDLSELAPVLALVRRPGNTVVVGGALAGLVYAEWPGDPRVDVLAVGEGERLVPALTAWLRGGRRELRAPEGGRVVRRGPSTVLVAGAHPSRSLDDLPTPDWEAAAGRAGQRWRVIHYESARGCPFRCAFCSYPLLFDDAHVRQKSAARVVDEWALYASQGFRRIACLDSLFTRPRARLVQVCERLIAQGSPVRWLAYARGDDLTDPDVVRLMADAGCVQVQVGVESGSPAQLANMDKRATVEATARGLVTAQQAGIATFVTVILGYPGETRATLEETWALLRDTRPDFAFATPFTARVPFVPVLSPEGRARFGLVTCGGTASSSPYWRHRTMSAADVGPLWRELHRRLADQRVSLDPSLFYGAMFSYRRDRDREALLDFQRDALIASPWVAAAFWPLRRWSLARLERDLEARLPLATAASSRGAGEP